MEDFSFNDEPRGGAFTFEHIGRLEAVKTSDALKEIDILLLTKVAPRVECPDAVTMGLEELPFEFYRRMESTGYDAHCEKVDQKEIASWQSAFPYFEVKGERMNIIGNSALNLSNTDDQCESFASHDDNNCASDNDALLVSSRCIEGSSSKIDLSIQGKRILIPRIEELNEDISHGICEDLITIDMRGDNLGNKDTDASSENILSPNESIQEEVVSLLFDAVWPEVVDALKPLVLRVVQVSHEIDLKYDAVKKRSDLAQSFDNDDRMSVEDGSDGW